MMNINMLSRLSVRSVIVIILVVGAFVLAVADHNFRPTFGDLAKVGVGGYLGQMLPEINKRSGDSSHFWASAIVPKAIPGQPKVLGTGLTQLLLATFAIA